MTDKFDINTLKEFNLTFDQFTWLIDSMGDPMQASGMPGVFYLEDLELKIQLMYNTNTNMYRISTWE